MRIFLFHRVSKERDEFWPPLRPSRFESLLRYIKNNYRVISLESLTYRNLTGREAAIVFDDGYKDFKDVALPILEKYKLPSSMYVVTNSVNTGKPIWTYEFDQIISQTKVKKLNDSSFNEILKLRNIRLTSLVDKQKSAAKIKAELKKVPNGDRIMLLNEIREKLGCPTINTTLMMNWDDLKEIKNRGVYIGSHTVSHPFLANIKSEKEIRNELEESRVEIYEKLGHWSKTISYPNGGYNDTVIRLAREVGYSIGLAVKQKSFRPKTDDFFEIPRIEVYDEPVTISKLRMKEIIQTVKRIINW